MLGARAVTRERVDVDSGTARLGQEVWSARTLSEDLVIDPETVCEVVDVRGVYLYLEPHDPSKPISEPGPAAAGEESQ